MPSGNVGKFCTLGTCAPPLIREDSLRLPTLMLLVAAELDATLGAPLGDRRI